MFLKNTFRNSLTRIAGYLDSPADRVAEATGCDQRQLLATCCPLFTENLTTVFFTGFTVRK
jgi:hypothetical protein